MKIDQSFKEEAPQFVRERLKPVLTTGVPSYDGANEKLVMISDPESADAESFRILRSEIFLGKDRAKPRTIMVTSVFPGEGKTFVASNLAASIAIGTDEQVLLVDSDLRRGTIHQVFGYQRTQGLTEYLDRKGPMEDLIVKTKIERLSILPAGQGSAFGSEKIGSSGMEVFMKEVKSRFHNWVVIIDTAPSPVMAGTRVIGRYVDGILFVVMARKSPRKEIQKSMASLGKEKVLGVVFNGYMHANREYRKYYEKYYGKK
jgi:capsular exopolysaccharide synthesis family protein